MLSKVKRILRRKFELYNLKLNKDKLIMQFKLDNFIVFNNKDFYIKLNGTSIPYSFKKTFKKYSGNSNRHTVLG
ncbi:hypothetical protein TMU3MR103_1438 [Tetragenococcus muriaticus 3MR10-3]|uniref:Uncharacterized protein n=1 Tax=Tetragenococcus muriaticus 3MR10-3 TaxID=1302648 RepID=A0A091C1D9_9ENTE|nr:hypothetical protein TMU3MR103_1438 [Tetragenococcus muriaticus 3MR10-3]